MATAKKSVASKRGTPPSQQRRNAARKGSPQARVPKTQPPKAAQLDAATLAAVAAIGDARSPEDIAAIVESSADVFNRMLDVWVPRTVGAPTKYRPEYAPQAYKLCLLGYTNEELGVFFGVNEETIKNWAKASPQFSVSLTRGRAGADADVATSLYRRAVGCVTPDSHISNFMGKVTVTPLEKHHPPDPGAAALWLHNRQPDRWRRSNEEPAKDLRAVADAVRAALRQADATTGGPEGEQA